MKVYQIKYTMLQNAEHVAARFCEVGARTKPEAIKIFQKNHADTKIVYITKKRRNKK